MSEHDARTPRPAPETLEEWLQRFGKKPVTGQLLMKTVDVLFEVLKAHKDRATALDARIAALEATPSLKFCGVWEPGRNYQPGDAATLKGSLWICKAATPGAPGVDFIGWQLAVKQGRI